MTCGAVQAHNRISLVAIGIVEILLPCETNWEAIRIDLWIGLTCKETEAAQVSLIRKQFAT